MCASRIARSTTLFLLLALAVAAPASVPLGVSYAISDSMAPTIGAHDGVVRVPAGNVERGDIVVFESPEADAQYTVHRVVEETPRGFVTKGDNNDVTDQAAGHPYVPRSRIHGQVLTIAGVPVTIPNLGVVLEHRLLLLTAVAALIAIDFALRTRGDRPARPMTADELLRVMTVVAGVAIVVMLVLGGTSARLTFVAVAGDASAPNAVPAGEPVTETLRVGGLRQTPVTHVAVDAGTMPVRNRTRNGSTLLLSVGLPPQRPEATYATTVRVHRYPTSLPPTVIEWLHDRHPLVAATATTAALVLPLYLLGRLLIDRRARLRTTAGRWRRWLRRLDDRTIRR